MFFLFVAFWAELAAGRAVPLKTEHLSDPDMQSTAQSLQGALKLSISNLKQKSVPTALLALPCTESAAHLDQSSAVARKLSQYQTCAEKLTSLSTDVIRLNNDLLQHLEGSDQDPAEIPSSPSSRSSPSSPSSPLTDFDPLRVWVQCVRCWIQQVEVLM